MEGQHGQEKCTQGFGSETYTNRSLERPKRKLEDNVKMDVQGIGWDSLDLIHLIHNRVK